LSLKGARIVTEHPNSNDLWDGWGNDDQGLIKTVGGNTYHVVDAGRGYRASVRRLLPRGVGHSTPLGRYPSMDDAVKACDGHAGRPTCLLQANPPQQSVKTRAPMYIRTMTGPSGVVYRYYSRTGCRAIRLEGEPGTPEFLVSYRAAVAAKPEPKQRRKSKPSGAEAKLLTSVSEAQQLAPEVKLLPPPDIKPPRATPGLSLLQMMLHEVMKAHPGETSIELLRLYTERLTSNSRLLDEAINRCFVEDCAELRS
jgi:hypothetical protein